MAIFSKEYACNLNKDDLIVFMEQKINERVKYREISLGTKKSHTVTLNHLKAWKKKIAFADLNEKTGEQFERFLKLHTGAKSKNARWGQHRNLKTYLNLAKKNGSVSSILMSFLRQKQRWGDFNRLQKPISKII